MPHLVKYSKADGQQGDHEVEELHDAIAYVERLRNEQGIEGAKIYRIEEVQFEFRPYYRVELGSAAMFTPSTPAAAPIAVTPIAPIAPVATLSTLPEAVAEAAAAPAWAPPAEPEPELEVAEVVDEAVPPMADLMATESDTDADAALPPVPAAALMADVEPTPMVDPWADAPPPPPPAEAEHVGSNGRRGLFGR